MNSILLSGIIVFILLLLIFAISILLRKNRLTPEETQKIQMLWLKIKSLEHDHPEQAILKADKLLDFTLGKLRYEGSLGEKLKKAGPLFSDINAVWRAHKLRNQVAHEIDAKIHQDSTTQALRAFQKAFLDLGIRL